MKKILRFSTHLLLAMAIAVAGCTSSYEDQVTPDDTLTPEEEGTTLSFSFDVADMEESGGDVTRAASTNESTIANLWILQYNSSSALVWSKYISNTTTLSSTFSLTVHPSAETLIFLANTSDTSFGSSTSAATLTALKAATYSVSAHDGVLVSSYFIMSGSLSKTNISTSATNNVTLTRNAAKVTAKIVNSLDSSEWTLTSIQTINMQNKSYYYPVDASTSTTFPTTSSTTDVTWSTTEKTSGTGSSGLTFYLPINKRGTYASNTTESDKTKNALTGATAIKITFTNVTTTSSTLVYTFYLGADLIDDYNLLGNKPYSYTFTLAGVGIGDSRVEWN